MIVVTPAMLTFFALLFYAPPSSTADLVEKIAASGRVLELAVPLSERVQPPLQIAPGAPPILTFRLLEGRLRSRYSNLDLVLDDAGH
jgi:hypothetical protein